MFTHPEGQARVGKHWPDGLHGRVAYEFLGCVVHGHVAECDDCPLSAGFTPADKGPFGLTLGRAYARWREKRASLIAAGYSVRHTWECQFDRLLSQDPRLFRFHRDLLDGGGFPSERLRLRDALRGGRTECFRLFYGKEADPLSHQHDLLYIDKNRLASRDLGAPLCRRSPPPPFPPSSLYPHQAITRQFPVGKPITLVGESLEAVEVGEGGVRRKSDGARLEGLVQCVVMAPDSLFLPVLPLRVRGKLMYGLCSTCLEKGLDRLCTHDGSARWLRGTWTTIELAYALGCGYRLVKVHELHVYERMGPIFEKFYLKLARIKLESEGFPTGVETPEDKQRHVDDLNDKMPGLDLSVDRVVKNEARRSFAKLVRRPERLASQRELAADTLRPLSPQVSNAGLGKFSQDDGKESSRFVRSWEELGKAKADPRFRFKRVYPLAEDLAEVVMAAKHEHIG